MDPSFRDHKIVILRYMLQSYVDSGFLMLFRHMDVGGGGKEEIIFLKQYGEQIARIKTDYLPELAELHCTYPLEGDYVSTNLVLEMVPPLPDLNWEHFIGERNIIIPGIRMNRYDIRVRSLHPPIHQRTESSAESPTPLEHRAAYQMTPEYFAAEMAASFTTS